MSAAMSAGQLRPLLPWPYTYDRIRTLLTNPDRRIEGDDVVALRSPLIYVWRRGERVLYVGMSTAGIGRPLNPQHHRLMNLVLGDHVDLYLFDPRHADARRLAILEGYVIQELRPELKRASPHDAGEPGGVSRFMLAPDEGRVGIPGGPIASFPTGRM